MVAVAAFGLQGFHNEHDRRARLGDHSNAGYSGRSTPGIARSSGFKPLEKAVIQYDLGGTIVELSGFSKRDTSALCCFYRDAALILRCRAGGGTRTI